MRQAAPTVSFAEISDSIDVEASPPLSFTQLLFHILELESGVLSLRTLYRLAPNFLVLRDVVCYLTMVVDMDEYRYSHM